MSEKRLSDLMSEKSHAVDNALEMLNKATIEAINFHFDAGIRTERERIIKLLEQTNIAWTIALIKGEK